jgi:transglycosylase-like protein
MVGITVAVVLFGASASQEASPAGADSIGSAKGQLDAIESQVAAGAAQIHALTLAYGQANFRATALSQQVTADQVDLAQIQQEVGDSRSALQSEAILSYTGAAMPSADAPLEGVSDPSIRAEYIQVAGGDLTEALDHYRAQEQSVTAAVSELVQQERQSQSAANQVAAARELALDEAAAEQTQLDQLQNQLDQLEATVLNDQNRSALAGQGLPVNDGVVTVVRTIVSPPPDPGPPTDGGGAGGVWLQLRECESGNNYRENTGNGYYGAYQFSGQTWTDLGFPGRPDLEPPGLQDAAAMKLQAEAGWGQWPACAAAIGLT